MWIFQAEAFKRAGPEHKPASPFSEQSPISQGVQPADVFFCGWDYASKPLPSLTSLFKPDPNFAVQDPYLVLVSGNPPITSITVQGVQKQQFEMPSYVAGTRSKVRRAGQGAEAINDLDKRLAEYGPLSGGEKIIIQLPLEIAGEAGQQINESVKKDLISGVKRSIQQQARCPDIDAYLQSNHLEIEVRAGEVSGAQFAANLRKLDLDIEAVQADARAFQSLKAGMVEYAVLPGETIALMQGAKTPTELAKVLEAHNGSVQFGQGYQNYPVLDRVFDLSRQVVVYNQFEFFVEVKSGEIRVRLQHPPADASKISKRFEERNNKPVFLLSFDANGNEIRTPYKLVYSKGDAEARVCSENGNRPLLSSFLIGDAGHPIPVGSSIALSLDGVNVDYRLFKTGETRLPPPPKFLEKTVPELPSNVPQFQGLLPSELSIQYGALDNTGPGFSAKDLELVNKGQQSTPHAFPIKTGTSDQSVIGINEVHVGTYRVMLQDEDGEYFKFSIKADRSARLFSPENPPQDDYGKVRVNALLRALGAASRVSKKDPQVKRDYNGYFYYELSDPLVMKVDISKPLMEFEAKGGRVESAALQVFVDDFQAKKWGSRFSATLNGQPAPFLSDVLNSLDQSGPVEQIVTIKIPPEFLDAVKSGRLTISISETTGKGDGYAIDALFLYVNPDQKMLDLQTAAESLDRAGTPQSQSGRRR